MGIQVFEQLRIQTTTQLQAFQVLAFMFVEFGALSFQNKTIWNCCLNFLVVLPLIGDTSATLLWIARLYERHGRKFYIQGTLLHIGERATLVTRSHPNS